ncbi:MAG: hypothetical protein Q7R98_01590 [Candidatus Jorgensenbacteria bacterium]|nr:hypothetical protein [Candidatus Jorgensenbacteria bacterium]
MDYSLLTQEIISDRFDTLPEHIQELLASEHTEKLVTQIGKSHYLSREKIGLLEQLVGLVLLGFLDMRDLKQELVDRLYMNFEHATALSNELASEIFNPVKSDLAQIYMPADEELALSRQGGSLLQNVPAQGKRSEEKTAQIPIREGASKQTMGEEGAPLILHEMRPLGPGASERTKVPFKDLSKSFSFFAQKITPQEIQNPVKAKIEAPDENRQVQSKPQPEKSFGSAQDKRVVHYSEFRTPISPVSRGGEFINLETFGGGARGAAPSSAPQSIKAPNAPVPPISPIPAPLPAQQISSPQKQGEDTMKGGVLLDGNIVNLKQ